MLDDVSVINISCFFFKGTPWYRQNSDVSNRDIPVSEATRWSCLGVRPFQHGRRPADREGSQNRPKGSEGVRQVARGHRLTCRSPCIAQSDQEHGQVQQVALEYGTERVVIISASMIAFPASRNCESCNNSRTRPESSHRPTKSDTGP